MVGARERRQRAAPAHRKPRAPLAPPTRAPGPDPRPGPADAEPVPRPRPARTPPATRPRPGAPPNGAAEARAGARPAARRRARPVSVAPFAARDRIGRPTR
ncbi:hypothetical protein GCM10023324_13620 [Streptomyces youssoufiensis]